MEFFFANDSGGARQGALQGKRIALTGRFPLPREEVKALIQKEGGIFSASVGKNTDAVVVGEAPGSKKEKALTNAVPLWTWKELKKALSFEA